jgi:predicted phosphodiesterase
MDYMQTIIFADLHGNLVALEKLLKLHSNIGNWISLGDNVNYGPWSNECIDILESDIKCQSILGNHEEAFIAGEYRGTHPTVVKFFDHCISSFDRREVIQKYPIELYFEGYTLVHTLENRYIYSDSHINIDRNYLVGHSHEQYIIDRNGFNLINPGSLGQDRLFINRGNYLLYDHASKIFEKRHFTFDIDILIQEMISQNYPAECVSYYKKKPRA